MKKKYIILGFITIMVFIKFSHPKMPLMQIDKQKNILMNSNILKEDLDREFNKLKNFAQNTAKSPEIKVDIANKDDFLERLYEDIAFLSESLNYDLTHNDSVQNLIKIRIYELDLLLKRVQTENFNNILSIYNETQEKYINTYNDYSSNNS